MLTDAALGQAVHQREIVGEIRHVRIVDLLAQATDVQLRKMMIGWLSQGVLHGFFDKVRYPQSVPRFACDLTFGGFYLRGVSLVAQFSILAASSRHCQARSRNINATHSSRLEAARRIRLRW
jgi:hypothetical protein